MTTATKEKSVLRDRDESVNDDRSAKFREFFKEFYQNDANPRNQDIYGINNIPPEFFAFVVNMDDSSQVETAIKMQYKSLDFVEHTLSKNTSAFQETPSDFITSGNTGTRHKIWIVPRDLREKRIKAQKEDFQKYREILITPKDRVKYGLQRVDAAQNASLINEVDVVV